MIRTKQIFVLEREYQATFCFQAGAAKQTKKLLEDPWNFNQFQIKTACEQIQDAGVCSSLPNCRNFGNPYCLHAHTWWMLCNTWVGVGMMTFSGLAHMLDATELQELFMLAHMLDATELLMLWNCCNLPMQLKCGRKSLNGCSQPSMHEDLTLLVLRKRSNLGRCEANVFSGAAQMPCVAAWPFFAKIQNVFFACGLFPRP